MTDDPLMAVGESGMMFSESFGEDIQTDVDVDLLAEALFDGSNNIDPLPGEFDDPTPATNVVPNDSANSNPPMGDGSFPSAPATVSGAELQNGGFPVPQPPQPQQPTQVVTPPSQEESPPQYAAGIAHNVVPQSEPLFKNKQHHEDMIKAAQAQLLASQPPAQPPVVAQSMTQPPLQPILPTSSVPVPAPAPVTPNPAVAAAASSQYVAIAPNMPAVNNSSMTVAADPSQQAFIFTTMNENGQQVSAAVPNPFLAMAAAASNPAVLAEQQQFMEAAMSARTRGRKKQVTPQQEEARKERNRELAKKTRERKKNYMDGLQEEVLELQKANAELKAMARQHMDEKDSSKLLEECNAVEKVPETVWEACGTSPTELAAEDFDMVTSIQKSQTAFCITDPSFDDNPIVFVSPDFLTMTGYKREQVIGRNCRFLQGVGTCPDKLDQIRRALAEGEDVGVTLVNYKADGTPFWNRLFIAAVRDINDNVVNYMGVAVEVARPEPGDPEHDKELR